MNFLLRNHQFGFCFVFSELCFYLNFFSVFWFFFGSDYVFVTDVFVTDVFATDVFATDVFAVFATDVFAVFATGVFAVFATGVFDFFAVTFYIIYKDNFSI